MNQINLFQVVTILAVFGLAVLLFMVIYGFTKWFYLTFRVFVILHLEPIFIILFNRDDSHNDKRDFYLKSQIIQGGVLGAYVDHEEVILAIDHLKEIGIKKENKKLSKDIVLILSKALSWHQHLIIKKKISQVLHTVLSSIDEDYFNKTIDPIKIFVGKILASPTSFVLLILVQLISFVYYWGKLDAHPMLLIEISTFILFILTIVTSYIPLYSYLVREGKASYAFLYSIATGIVNIFIIGWYLSVYSTTFHFGYLSKAIEISDSPPVTMEFNYPEWISPKELASNNGSKCESKKILATLESSVKISKLGFDQIGFTAVPDIVVLYDENCDIFPEWQELDSEEKNLQWEFYVSPKSNGVFEITETITIEPVFVYRGGIVQFNDLKQTIRIEHPVWGFLRNEFRGVSIIALLVAFVGWLISKVPAKTKK